MSSIQSGFSKSYAEARQKFLDAAQAAGLKVQSHHHPRPGRDGESLAMDVVREGPADAKNLLIISSACHGVEGYCGSGVQVNALRDAAWRRAARDAGVAVLYIHALNPYGFSHIRRATHENVDLNRNFHDFSRPLPVEAFALVLDGFVRVHGLTVMAGKRCSGVPNRSSDKGWIWNWTLARSCAASERGSVMRSVRNEPAPTTGLATTSCQPRSAMRSPRSSSSPTPSQAVGTTGTPCLASCRR